MTLIDISRHCSIPIIIDYKISTFTASGEIDYGWIAKFLLYRGDLLTIRKPDLARSNDEIIKIYE